MRQDRRISSRADLDAAEASLEVADGRYEDALEEIRTRQALVLQRESELDAASRRLARSETLAAEGAASQQELDDDGAQLTRAHQLQ